MNTRYPIVTQSSNGYCPAQVTPSTSPQVLTQDVGAMGPTWEQVDISQATCPAWTPFTCTMTAGSGAITTQVSGMSYLQIGKLVFVNGTVQVTNIGSASGAMFFSIPVMAKKTFTVVFREIGVNGTFFSATVSGGTLRAQVFTSANANPTWANNFAVAITFSYEAS